MGDIALRWDVYAADLAIEAGDLAIDDGLETAVILSLFTDRRARASDQLPDGQIDRRGWWGDVRPPVADDLCGSRLWLLGREKETSTVLERAREYATEALTWLILDGVAAAVDVVAEFVSAGVLGLHVAIQRPSSDTVDFRFELAWSAQEARH